MAAAISQKQLDKKFPQGIRVFAPRENAPSFVNTYKPQADGSDKDLPF